MVYGALFRSSLAMLTMLLMSDASNIDISWAVDKNGKYVKLPGIDFVKVYSAIRQENGMLGEVSTEVTGAYDLRIK